MKKEKPFGQKTLLGQSVRLITTVLTVLLLSGCADVFTDSKTSQEATSQYVEAQSAYMSGAVHNLHREWNEAIDEFDSALMILSRIDISQQDRHLQEKIDGLFREISYDYKIALANTDGMGSGTAPAVISMALEDGLYSDKTRKELSELLEQLPAVTSEGYDYPIVWNEIVKEKILLFQSEAYHDKMNLWVSRSTKYMPMIKRVFREEGIPLDLGYLPLVESGYNSKANSWAGAAGIWQFIRATGKHYGLTSDWWMDERRDPEKATRAAAKYLKTLYGMFNDWELALASYNCGENRVKRLLNEENATTFWEIRDRLPKETRNYVPLFNAALIIAKNPRKYGFSPVYESPVPYDIVKVSEPVNLDLVAEITDSEEDVIRELNAELLRWCTPPGSYSLKIPAGTGAGFHTKYAKIPESRKTVWQKHKVTKGETLSLIAARYGTSISALEKANSLTNRHKLSIGQVLLVPVAGSTSKDYAGNSRVTTQSPTSHYARSSKNHTVRRGDTPSEIAEAYGIPLSELYAANNMSRRSVIKVGQVLKIPGAESSVIEPLTSSNTTSGVTVPTTEKTVGSYTVKQGDTPLHIAIEHDMTLNQFLDLNSLGQSSVIYPGQSLKVYAAASTVSKSKIDHSVKSGESLWTIAKKYSVSVSDLVYWNGYSSSNKTLHPGDKVTIIAGESGLTQQSTQKSEVIHTVKSGESLYKIAGKYGVSIEEIRNWNGKKGSDLAIGEKLSIYIDRAESPKPSPTTGKQIVHKIRQGDTLWDIAQKYNVTTSDILSQNGIKDPTALRVGDEIKIFIE